MKGPGYLDFMVEHLSPLGAITVRSMFGGHGVYCNGVMFALVASGALYLKADEINRAKFLERGLLPFQPFPDKPGVMQYYPAPPEIFEDPKALKQWAGGALQAGLRAAARKRTPGVPKEMKREKPSRAKSTIRNKG
jgi:DNA transformation protein